MIWFDWTPKTPAEVRERLHDEWRALPGSLLEAPPVDLKAMRAKRDEALALTRAEFRRRDNAEFARALVLESIRAGLQIEDRAAWAYGQIQALEAIECPTASPPK